MFHAGLEAEQKYELQTRELVGKAFGANFGKIWDCLMNGETHSISACGTAEAGKTYLVTDIHNRILQESNMFDVACWVTVSQECSRHKLNPCATRISRSEE
ncbi:hypothetical protein ACJRO7_023139 [Eucalyptus globulus]|uniref:NB-ARC domain-containing protein n=1 Tax=Eucalyptus globulus TaxID=34317 RepID=A0ABD3KDP9_EUCGL